MKTWMIETIVVSSILTIVSLLTGGGWLEILGTAAVTASFCHAQVADRLAEKDAARERPSVSCHRWATRYLITKEVLWLAYFVAHKSWAALAGVFLFLLYPLWRRLWRTGNPLTPENPYA